MIFQFIAFFRFFQGQFLERFPKFDLDDPKEGKNRKVINLTAQDHRHIWHERMFVSFETVGEKRGDRTTQAQQPATWADGAEGPRAQRGQLRISTAGFRMSDSNVDDSDVTGGSG